MPARVGDLLAGRCDGTTGNVLPAPAQQPDAEYGCRGASVTRRVWPATWEVGLTSIPARH